MFNKPIKTDSEGNITEITITEKMQKRLRKAHKDDFMPCSTSIKKMCDEGSHPEYFNQIRNRIFRELEEDSELGNYVAIDLNDFEDVRLTADGVFIFFEILTSYFKDDDVRDMLVLMKKMDESARARYNLEHSLSRMTKQELKDFIAGYKDYIPEKGMEEAKQILMDMVQEKLKKRKLFT